MRKIAYLFLLVLGITSCATEPKTWTFQSADKEVEIKIVATKAVEFDPYEVAVLVKAYGNEKSFSGEINNMGLTDEEVKVTWIDNQHCTLSFTESDNTEVKISISAEPAGIFIKPE